MPGVLQEGARPLLFVLRVSRGDFDFPPGAFASFHAEKKIYSNTNVANGAPGSSRPTERDILAYNV